MHLITTTAQEGAVIGNGEWMFILGLPRGLQGVMQVLLYVVWGRMRFLPWEK
jgi:hypothetical protein